MKPTDITKIVNECVAGNFKFAEQMTIEDQGRFINFPYCTKNNFLCEYAGQNVMNQYFVCDGKLKQEKKEAEEDGLL